MIITHTLAYDPTNMMRGKQDDLSHDFVIKTTSNTEPLHPGEKSTPLIMSNVTHIQLFEKVKEKSNNEVKYI